MHISQHVNAGSITPSLLPFLLLVPIRKDSGNLTEDDPLKSTISPPQLHKCAYILPMSILDRTRNSTAEESDIIPAYSPRVYITDRRT